MSTRKISKSVLGKYLPLIVLVGLILIVVYFGSDKGSDKDIAGQAYVVGSCVADGTGVRTTNLYSGAVERYGDTCNGALTGFDDYYCVSPSRYTYTRVNCAAGQVCGNGQCAVPAANPNAECAVPTTQTETLVARGPAVTINGVQVSLWNAGTTRPGATLQIGTNYPTFSLNEKKTFEKFSATLIGGGRGGPTGNAQIKFEYCPAVGTTAPAAAASCTDTDVSTAKPDGKDYFRIGRVTFNGVESRDTCVSTTRLKEYSCLNGQKTETEVDCRNAGAYNKNRRCREGGHVTDGQGALCFNS